MKLEEYAERLNQETIALADSDSEGTLRAEVFTEIVGQRLAEAGEMDGFEAAYHRGHGVELSGWSYDPIDEVLHLSITDYRGGGTESLSQTQIAALFKRLTSFVERSVDHLAEALEPSSPAFEVADLIRAQWKSLTGARLYLFSDAKARKPQMAPTEIRGAPITFHVWDLERLYRLDTSGLEREAIVVDLEKRLGAPLPCLQGDPGKDHQVYLTLLPGSLLAALYNEYNSRLLERNVRSFLQQRGAVNKGIRETILKASDRFLAYNNGVSATASRVDLVTTSGGVTALARIHDLQIVNGGQTTASLGAALRRDKADVSCISVQCKLTVVAEDTIDELVAHISQFSNTQNKVTGADFSANDPFHVKLEEHSRSIWAPAADGSQRQTHWFFERARGQYADEHMRARTPSKQQQFKSLNPTSQKFTKTDLAKFENSWEQLPHLVSLGAEKNFREFMLLLAERRREPDADYFQRLIAKAILFRRTEKLVDTFKFGGYRANLVTYAIAKLSNATASRLDLGLIWKAQQLTPATELALQDLIPHVRDVVFQPTGRVRHIGEWCKKIDCWASVRDLDWHVPTPLAKELIPLRRGGKQPNEVDLGLAEPTKAQTDLVTSATEVTAETWFRVSNWAKETDNLQSWQRSLAHSLGRVATSGKQPSVKQATQGMKLLEEAIRLGFE